MPTTQHFEMLTLRGKIALFKPHNPFAPGIVEQINAYPIEQQAQVLSDILTNAGSGALLEVVALNADYDVVLYNLTITVQ